MDDIPIPGRDEERNLFKQFVAQFGEPAFLRRARRVQEAFDQLVSRQRLQRDEHLRMVRLRLSTLQALAGDWTALRPLLSDDRQIDLLQQLHAELNPQLRIPVEPTSSPRRLKRALQELIESIERFNRAWQAHLSMVDLTHVNELRDGYNRWYVLEKECALRSPRLARMGFRKLEPVTHEELAVLLPPLPVPQVRVQRPDGG